MSASASASRGSDSLAAPHVENRRHYRYYDLIMAGFVTVLVCSNLIGPGKLCAIDLKIPIVPEWSGGAFFWSSLLVFGAGNVFFPISYIFGDILTEVYGYARARKVIWAGFAGMLFATLMSIVVVQLPRFEAAVGNHAYVDAVHMVFGPTWRIVLASILAFWIGDFVNSFVLAKMKVLTRGRFLWTRTIGSTICGQGVDSLIFYPIAFYQTAGWDTNSLLKAAIFNWVFKVMVEVVLTPATYLVVGALKRAEGEDYFDEHTNFTPFSLKD